MEWMKPRMPTQGSEFRVLGIGHLYTKNLKGKKGPVGDPEAHADALGTE